MSVDTASKRDKLEEGQVKQELFELFADAPEMGFDDINREIDQPSGYLKGILDQICVKRKFRNRFVYSLKAEYLRQDRNEPPLDKPEKRLKK